MLKSTSVCCFFIIYLKLCHGQNQNIIVTNNPYCTQIGRQLIEIGGNVREIFIAVSLCEGFVHPMDSGIGGGFQAVYYNFDNNSSNAVFLDSREQAPSNSQFTNYPIKDGNSIGIPSVLAGYESLYNIDQHKNRLKWSQIIQPVLDLCKTGFIMSTTTKKMFEILIQSYNNTQININRLNIPNFCHTLIQISLDGPSSSMYRFGGYLNRLLYNDLRGVRSLISLNDIRKYRPKITKPAIVQFDKFTVYASKSPGSGQAVLFALKIIEKLRRIISPSATNSEKLVYLLKILKYTYAFQPHLRELNEPTINKIINFSSHSLAEGIVKNGIKFQKTIPTKFGNVTLAKLVSPLQFGTTNIVVKVGNSAITASSSINLLFGSGILSENMGFFYNNQLKDFSNPNWRRKKKALKNTAGPSKVPSSSISPIIMVDSTTHAPVLQIGSAGGSKILSAIVNTLFNYFILNKSLQQSVDSCRVLPKFNYNQNKVKFLYECIEDERIASHLRNNGIDFQHSTDAGHAAVTALSKLRRGYPEAVFDKRRGGLAYISR